MIPLEEITMKIDKSKLRDETGYESVNVRITRACPDCNKTEVPKTDGKKYYCRRCYKLIGDVL